MKVLIFAASSRAGSLNRRLALQASNLLSSKSGIEVQFVEFKEFDMPIYGGDFEEASGLPSGAEKLGRYISQTDAIVISTPEYNGSIPGPLKNALDWISRIKPAPPISSKHILLLGASPGALGAVRGLWHTRVPLEALGAYVYPQMFGLAKAHEAFDDSGAFKESRNLDNLSKLIDSFLKHQQN